MVWHRLCSDKLKNFEKEVKVKEKRGLRSFCNRCGAG